MTLRSPRHPGLSAGLALTTVLGGCLMAGCGPARSDTRTATTRLVAFTSCDDLLRGLRGAARTAVGPYGLGTAWSAWLAAGGPAGAAPGAAEPGTDAAARRPAAVPAPGTPAYSATNTREVGVDEPDLVKTDGRRIVTVHAGVLRVVDAAQRRFTGSLDLTPTGSPGPGPYPANLLLSGDHALLLDRGYAYGGAMTPGGLRGGVAEGSVGRPAPDSPVVPGGPVPVTGPRLLLVDLSGTPRLLGTYEIDGALLDARQIGSTVRVVTRSAPRLRFPLDTPSGVAPAPGGAVTPAGPEGAGGTGAAPGGRVAPTTDAARIAANRAVVDTATPDDWLPRYRATAAGTRPSSATGRVGCGAVSRPASYTGTSMITVTTFDLRRDALGSGDPVTVVADADTVYATGTSLYLAATALPRFAGAMPARPGWRATTDIYRFDIGGGDRPVYRAAGTVPGRLLNQYALDEWDGTLRVATTADGIPAGDVPVPGNGESAVYVLREKGTRLTVAGHVGGLGRGERIYAVRFAGPTGYVVTFRQTDPLYTVDLREPARPRVRGELTLTGYSAYLHPLDGPRLLGIGQEASAQGRIQGTQVSLFDAADPAAPRLLDRYRLPVASSSLAEYDPHAFLYWPAAGLLVVPVSAPWTDRSAPGLLALRVDGDSLRDLGWITQPAGAEITRSLVVDRTLWTISEAGLAANDLGDLRQVAWLPY